MNIARIKNQILSVTFCRRVSALAVAALWLFAVNLTMQAADTDAKPFLQPLFTDHVVLQRDARVPVWGWAAPGAKITVCFAGQTRQAKADTSGKWTAYLKPMKASSEPRELVVSSSAGNAATGQDQTVTVADVLVGDVWLCSGQSNKRASPAMTLSIL